MKDPALTRLRQQLRATPATAPQATAKPTAPARPPEPEVDDATLFARATQGARPITSDSAPVAPARPDPNAPRRRAAAEAEQHEDSPLSDAAALMYEVMPEAALTFARNGVQQQVLRKLRQGQMPWHAAVDLHGCTAEQAREAVLTLLHDARQANLQVIKVVHGKGLVKEQALLKTFVNGWLRQIPEVLAFVSALPRDGGTGAIYVLLKRRRPDEHEG
jgi:DNA-nicking Smr family endonuclease